LGLLLRFDLGYSEATYGIAMTIMCGANFLVFTAAARAHKWHYVLWLFQSSQLIMAAAMLLPVRYSQQWILLAAAGIVGTSQAFIYVSHLFYGVSGGRRRLGLMAVHEFLLSGGIVMGSVAGGYISDSFGRRAPYLFGTAAVVVGLLIQAAIRARLGTRQAR
jgi:predicted MFS family arabinose efflux permease